MIERNNRMLWAASLRIPVWPGPLLAAFVCFDNLCRTSLASGDDEIIDVLIERLVSPNEKPRLLKGFKGDHDVVYPRDYDHPAQKPILAAWDALVAKGIEAFPALIRHLNDRRYSCTVRTYTFENFSVGDVCTEVIRAQVEVYEAFVLKKPGDFGHYLKDSRANREIKQWWEKRKGSTLHDLQLEAVRWAAAREKSRTDYPDDYRAQEFKAKNLAGLERLLRRLESSDKPIRVDRKGHVLEDK